MWGVFHWYHDGRVQPGRPAPRDAPFWINWPTTVLYSVKMLSVLIAYCLVLRFIWNELVCCRRVLLRAYRGFP